MFHTLAYLIEHGISSSLAEMQYCRRPRNSAAAELLSLPSLEFRKDDSLYIDDEGAFYDIYSPYFTGGTYGNLKTGPVDVFGVNYYSPLLAAGIIEKLRGGKPPEYETLIKWLENAVLYNGFYILGI